MNRAACVVLLGWSLKLHCAAILRMAAALVDCLTVAAGALTTQGRAQRLKWRTEDARMQRHATVLRRFWQTNGRFTLGDALFVGLFMAGAAGIALAWRPQLEALRQQEQAGQAPLTQQAQQQHVQQQQQPVVQAPSLPAAAAVAAGAAAAAQS